jgi:hypothetical protein
MTNEPFWDELGIAWQAASPAIEVPLDRMKGHFRRETRQVRLAIVLAGLLGTLGAGLGVLTLIQGWRLGALNFATRGIGVLVAAGILWTIVATLWPVRRGEEARSLKDFADLGLARARRGRRVVVLGLAGIAGAAVLGVIGAVIRSAVGRPPALSPFIDLAVLALLAGIAEALRRRFRGEEARFAYLRKALQTSD